jgi:PAS domain S-box-containing protein
MFINLINNVAFLIALVAAGQIVIDRFPQKTLNRQVLLGLLFGGVALLGMANPVNFSPGVFFDGRSMVLVVAGVVGGGVTAAIAAGMAAVYRYQLGGIGAPVGIFVSLVPALLGALARHWWQQRTQPPRLTDYLALGVVVQFIQLAAFTQIPNRAGYAFIEQAGWVLLLFYPLATMLLCQIFRNHEQRLIDTAALQSAKDAVIAEERTSMQRFHAYFDHSIVGLAITSLDKGWIEVNGALCATLGYTRDELTRMNWVDLTYPEDLAADQEQFNRMLSGEIKGYAMDKRFIHKDGHLVDTRLAVGRVCKPDGKLDYVVAMVEDVSDRRKAEKEYEDMFREMLDGFALHEIICDADGQPQDYRFLAVNPAFERMAGLKAADLVGRTVLEVLPATEKHWIEAFGKVAISGDPVFFAGHYAAIGKDFEVKAFCPSVGRFASVFADITERTQAENALRRMVKDLGETQRIAHIGSWHLDLASNQVVWTEELYKMYGFDPTLPVPPYTEHMKLFTPESWERLSSALAHTRETGVPYTLELQTVRKDGSSGWLWARGEAEVDLAGKTIGLWGAAQDITERKQAHQAVLEALTRVDRLAQHVPGMLYQYHLRPDGTSHFPYASAGIKEIYGVLPEQVSQDAEAVFKLGHPDDFQQVIESIQASARTLNDWHKEYRVNLPDGRTIWVEGEASPEAAPDGGVLWNGHIRDITERKKTEALLHEQLDELHRWQQTMLGREGRIISIKQEVNELLARSGQPPRYATQLPEQPDGGGV